MIAAAIGPIFTFLDDALKRAFPDKTERERIQAQLQMEILKGDVGLLQQQILLNTEEAKNPSLFVSGWRPAVGWTCAGAYAWTFVVAPFAQFTLQAFGVHLPPLPVLSLGELGPVLFGMLGLGAYRSYEKVSGVARK